jgi:hypothetical protein
VCSCFLALLLEPGTTSLKARHAISVGRAQPQLRLVSSLLKTWHIFCKIGHPVGVFECQEVWDIFRDVDEVVCQVEELFVLLADPDALSKGRNLETLHEPLSAATAVRH